MDHEPEGAQAASRLIWLDEAVFASVRDLLTTELGGVGQAFALLDLDDGGLRGAAVNAQTGQCLIELNDNTLHSASFDRAMADHLVRIGKTATPTTAEWAQELVGMMSQARALLGIAEATFVMGKEHVGLLRVTRDDMEQALASSAVRAISVARSVSLASPSPICALVVTSHQVEWPGLVDKMTRAFDGLLPILAIRTSPVPVRPGKHSRGADAAAALPDSVAELAPVEVYIPQARTEPTPMPVQPKARPKAEAAEQLPDPLPEPFPSPVVDFDPVAEAQAAQRRKKQNRLVLAAAASVAGVIVAGGITAAVAPWADDTGGLESQRYLTAPTARTTSTTTTSAPAPGGTDVETPSAATTSTPSATSTPPPIDTDAARAPIVIYTAPPPPQTTPTTRRPTQRPRTTIPNPIPGQPPIVLP